MDRRDDPQPACGVFKNRSELAAYELVPQFLGGGAIAEPYDRCGRQGVVDFLLRYLDGRTAALEVTSYAASDMRQLDSLLRGRDRVLSHPGQWTWYAGVEDPGDLLEFKERLNRLVIKCEAAGISHPDCVSHPLDEDPDVEWLIDSATTLYANPNQQEGVCLVHHNAVGAILGDVAPNGFAEAIEDILQQGSIQHRLKKLADSGYDERHLFVELHFSALPFGVFDAIAVRDHVPQIAPARPQGLAYLWLTLDFTPFVFRVADDGIQMFRSTQSDPLSS